MLYIKMQEDDLLLKVDNKFFNENETINKEMKNKLNKLIEDKQISIYNLPSEREYNPNTIININEKLKKIFSIEITQKDYDINKIYDNTN